MLFEYPAEKKKGLDVHLDTFALKLGAAGRESTRPFGSAKLLYPAELQPQTKIIT